MKYGFNLLLWTGHVTDEYAPLLQALKETGFGSTAAASSDVRHRGGIGGAPIGALRPTRPAPRAKRSLFRGAVAGLSR